MCWHLSPRPVPTLNVVVICIIRVIAWCYAALLFDVLAACVSHERRNAAEL